MITRIKQFVSEHLSGKRALVLDAILNQMKQNRQKSDILVFSFQPTGSSYLGVYNATNNLFPGLVVTLPAYHSNCLLSSDDFEVITKTAVELEFSQVVFGTMPPSLTSFAKTLSTFLRVKMIFHGALSELSNKNALQHFEALVDMQQNGHFSSIGFVKSGMETWYTQCFGSGAYRLELFPKQMDQLPARSDGYYHIGIFVNDSFNKNKVTQIAAALMIPDARVHVLCTEQDFAFMSDKRIISHDPLPHSEFIQLLGSMDVNLHVTFSEGMGGQTFMESLQMGVPCITSHTHRYLRFSKDLQQKLIIDEHDNPTRIAEFLEEARKVPRETWKMEFDQYNERIYQDAETLLSTFKES
jgi:hypothetical protein